MKRLMILPLLLVVLVSFTAADAKPGKKQWQWWTNERITKELDLSQDQQSRYHPHEFPSE